MMPPPVGDVPDMWHIVCGTDGPVGGMARNAAGSVCRSCKAAIITGLDEDMCALDAYADPHPISATGEALAILTGLPTYVVRRRKGGWQLERRDAADMAWAPAGQVDVFAFHRCGLVLPRAVPIRRRPVTYAGAVPPF